MLFVTAQPYPLCTVTNEQGEQHTERCVYSETNIPEVSELGLRPMEAVPVTTFRETMAALMLMTPSLPQCFCVFQVSETDVTVVKKSAYYKGFVEENSCQYVRADEETPTADKMYFLDASKLTEQPLICGDVSSMLSFKQTGNDFAGLLHLGIVRQSAPPEFMNDVRKRAMRIDEGSVDVIAEMCTKRGLDHPQERAQILVAWRLYRMCIVPLILWDLCTDTGSVHRDDYHSLNLELMAVESCTNTWRMIDVLCGQMTAWLGHGCDVADEQAIYDGMLKAIIDNVPVLSAWLTNQDISRNDLCPCGSGLKYKKCHGSWK